MNCTMCFSVSKSRSIAWRCHDCFGDPSFCTQCIQQSHELQPFHRVSHWDGTSFFPSSLSNAGLTLNLGHSGRLCAFYNGRSGYSAQSAQYHTEQDVEMQRGSRTDSIPHPHYGSVNTHHLHPEGTHPSDATRFTSGIKHSFSATIIPVGPCDPSMPYEHKTHFWEHPEPPKGGGPSSGPLQPTIQPSVVNDVDTSQDSFFAREDGGDEGNRNSSEPAGAPPHIKRGDKRYDDLQCPILTVVDTSGIHEIRTRFCRCGSLSSNPLHTQLIKMGLYPSSTDRTRTVFTFRVLHHFDLTNLEGKTSAWQYYTTLRRLTSNVFPDTAVDRYRELMRALRQWRDLTTRRRAGLPLDTTVQLRPGSLALFCPACPQPGVNLPENWKDDPQQYVPPSSSSFPKYQFISHP